MRQLSNRVHRRQLHLFVNRRCADVQRAAEDEREAQHVVHLVRIVGAAGTNNGVGAHLFRQRRQNLRLRVSQRQNHRRAGHFLHHLLSQHFRARAAEENVRPVNHVIQRAFAAVFNRIGRFRLRHIRLAALIDNAFRVADHDVVFLHPQRHQQVHTGNRRRARAGDHHPHVGDVFLHHPQTVKNRRGTDNRCPVLIVMENRNIHALAQLLLDVEALRRFDIFKVDTAEGRLQRRDDVDKFVRVQFIDFNIEHIDTGEFFKQNAFAFHHRLTGQRADIAQPQNGRAVGDHRHKVAARGIFIGCQRILLDFQTGRGNARRVGQGQIALGSQRFCRGDLDFSGDREFVEIKGALF